MITSKQKMILKRIGCNVETIRNTDTKITISEILQRIRETKNIACGVYLNSTYCTKEQRFAFSGYAWHFLDLDNIWIIKSTNQIYKTHKEAEQGLLSEILKYLSIHKVK